MDPATGAIGRLLPKLDELQKSMRKEAASLRERLTAIEPDLRKADGLPVNQVTLPFKEWSREARDLSYDIEHVIDRFRARQLRARQSKADDATAADRKDIIAKISYKMAIGSASRRFATEFRCHSNKLTKLIKDRPGYTTVATNLGGPVPVAVVGELSDQEDPVAGEVLHQDSPVVGDLSDRRDSQLVGEVIDGDDAVTEDLKEHDDDSVVGEVVLHQHDPEVGDLSNRGDPVAGDLSNRDDPEVGEFIHQNDLVVGDLSNQVEDLSHHHQDNLVVGDLNIRDGPVVTKLSIRGGSVFGKLDLGSRVDKLVNIFTSHGEASNRQLKVASILGRPGVGKTTLADQVYKQLMPRFERSAWITMSTKPDVKTVLRNMLSQITLQGDASFGLTSIQETIDEIKNALKDKRYFIVFDDMCDNKAWKIIKNALVDVSNFSAVLMTSRNVSVARYACGIIYRLRSPSDVSSKQLSNQRLVVGSGDNCPPQSVNIPSRLLQKDSSIPSAIIRGEARTKQSEDNYPSPSANIPSRFFEKSNGTPSVIVSGKARTKQPEDNFQPQSANIPSRVLEKNSSIPSTINTIHETGTMLAGKVPGDGDTLVDTTTGVHAPSVPPRVGGTRAPVLQGPSVSTVPRHLKPCLMYLSMFENGHEIGTDRLVWGWIAEGFITGEAGMTLREQGESYLTDLISRGFLEAIKVDPSGKARSCRLHNDEVYSSIASLSAEENSVTIVRGEPVTHLQALARRLSIQGNNTPSTQVPLISQWLYASIDAEAGAPPFRRKEVPSSRVTSLVLSGDAIPFHQESGGTNSFLSHPKFQNLIVLDLGGCASLKNDHLKGIESLLLLKYLVLGGDCITDIPRQIGDLVFLQTLDLRASRVKELPESIALARKLECLLVNRHTKIPDAIGKMKALEVLGDINISSGKLLEELRKLPALRVLRIVIWSWNNTYNEELLGYLGSLSNQKIQSLSIFICCSLDFLEEWDAVPTTNNQHLQELEIKHSTFVKLPKWISSLTQLSSLSIEVHKLSQEIIEILEKLSTLGSLFLSSKHAPEPKANFKNGFRNLTSFHFVSSALGMIFVPGGLLKLERLHLSFQASLTKDFSEDFDFGLENLSSLKRIHVEIICFNATSRVVQDIEKAIIKAIHRKSSGRAELVIDELRKEDMEKNEDGQETQGCSPIAYFDFIKKLSLDRRKVMEEVGFGGLLKMKGVKIRHELCKRLAEAYDVQSEAFNIRGDMLQISIKDVGLLMGIPSEGEEIVEVPKRKNLVLLSSYEHKNGTINLDTLQEYLSSNRNNDEHFVRGLLLYTIGMLLCPTTQRNVSSDYLNLLEDVEQIKTVNWASLTLHHLKDSLKKYKAGKANIEGNLVLLQLWYWEKMYISKPE